MNTPFHSAVLALAAVVLPLPFLPATEAAAPPAVSTPKGLRIYSAGHSFHMFMPPILTEIAKSAGIVDHRQVGVSSIGGSYLYQHWAKEGEKSARAMIESERPDIFTMSPLYLPDDGIENFAKLVAEKSPKTRILLQEFWLPFDVYDVNYKKKRPPDPDRDAMTADYLRSEYGKYFKAMDAHVSALNRKYGATLFTVTPVGQAVVALREKVIAGEVPGVTKQSELFTDAIGHCRAHLKVLNAYCHFAVIYGRNPVGLPVPAALKEVGDEATAAKVNLLLQTLAWNAVIEHPLVGLRGARYADTPAGLGTGPAINRNWGKWGPNDELGTLNYITPEVIRHAATLVRKGKVISLALPLGANQPIMGNRQINHIMIQTGQDVGNPRRKATDDYLYMAVHGTTHWDGLPHFFADRRLYNGYDVASVTFDGAGKGGIQNASDKMVTRGVFIDLARAKGVPRLKAGYAITPEDLEGAASRQGVEFRPGDVILIRTGWINTFYEEGRQVFLAGQPGLGWASTQWLQEVQAAAVALDNPSVEVSPPEPRSMSRNGHPYWPQVAHYELLHNQGMLIGELFYFEKLARDCAADGVYEFLFVAQPLNLTGGTGSPLNPQAIK